MPPRPPKAARKAISFFGDADPKRRGSRLCTVGMPADDDSLPEWDTLRNAPKNALRESRLGRQDGPPFVWLEFGDVLGW